MCGKRNGGYEHTLILCAVYMHGCVEWRVECTRILYPHITCVQVYMGVEWWVHVHAYIHVVGLVSRYKNNMGQHCLLLTPVNRQNPGSQYIND